MSQEQSTEAQRAEERTQDTRAFVRRVRTLTRRKYTPDEKIRIVLEGFRREVTVSDLCRGGAGTYFGEPDSSLLRYHPDFRKPHREEERTANVGQHAR